jgi:anti-sigma factor RsiW
VAHPGAELTGYVTDALAADARARVAAHLDGCAECRRAVEESRTVLAALGAGALTPPPVDWGRYGAELWARVRSASRRPWWARPLPVALAVGAAAAVLLLVVRAPERRPVELAAVEETMLGARLPLLQQYRVVERLELLEDLDAIRHLDGLAAGGG